MAMLNPTNADGEDSPVLSRLYQPVTAVARPERPWLTYAGVGGIALLGIVVFTSLNSSRIVPEAKPALLAAKPQVSPMPVTRMPMELPPMQMPQTAVVMPAEPSAALPPMPVSVSSTRVNRLGAPAMVVDVGPEGGVTLAGIDPGKPTAATAPATAADQHLSADERFAARVSGAGVETANATRLGDTALVAPQGTVIPAVIETAINSDLPGFVRAVVTRDVRGFDGSTVLIPRGSRLIGQYRSGIAVGQSRAFVVWSRVLTPEGVSVDIESPGTDRLGRAGLQGETNSHFFKRFGSAILLSVLSAGLQAVATANGSPTTAVIIGSQQQATDIASLALQKNIDIPVTITVAQGTPIRVFIARDLDFSGVAKKTP